MRADANPTSAATVDFTVTFSEPTITFDVSDVVITGTAPGTLIANVTGTGTTYNVAVSGMAADGTVSVSIPAGVATDAAGNTGEGQRHQLQMLVGLARPGHHSGVVEAEPVDLLQTPGQRLEVAAVEQGRVIFNNIRKFVLFLLSLASFCRALSARREGGRKELGALACGLLLFVLARYENLRGGRDDALW